MNKQSGRPADSKSRSVRRRPPNYFSRREQFRLFILCTTLMLVLGMMNEARKPANWEWMWGTAGASAPPSEGPIETRVEVPNRKLPKDGFILSPTPRQTSTPPETQPFVAGITAEMLADVEDNTVLRARENPAWLAMFRILREKSQTEIESLSIAKVGFAQLFRQTKFYRGRLVTIAGTARRLERVEPRSNDAGIDQLYRWIVEPTGGSNSPIVVYSIEKPDELEVGALREDCQFTGFCFKRWAYAAGDGTRIAPLLLAKNISWVPAPPLKPVRLPSTPGMALLVLVLLVLSIAVALAVYRSTVRPSPNTVRLRESTGETEPRFDDTQVSPDIGQRLRDLAEKDR